MGLISYPYIFIYEFLAPVIEMIGYLFTIYLIIIGGINWDNAILMLFFAYLFGVSLSLTTILYERLLEHRFNNREYIRLVFFCFLEPFIYHPLIVFFNIRGYIDYLTKTNFEWGTMTRQGFDEENPNNLKEVGASTTTTGTQSIE